MYPPTHRVRRLPDLLLFAGFTAWYFGARALAASSANGLAGRFPLGPSRDLVEAAFHLFLLILGFVVLRGIARHTASLRELTALPPRPTQAREVLSGAALGWAIVVVCLLPLLLSGHLHTRLVLTAPVAGAAILSVATLALATLTHEIAFRGYPFRALIRALGPSGAILAMVAAAGFSTWRDPDASSSAVLAAMLLTLLLSLSWLRTHAVWFAWGLRFALIVSLGVLFGLPSGKAGDLSSLIQGTTYGPDWLTGGTWGPTAAAFSTLVLLAAIPILYGITRNFAWSYTHAPILPAGYEVTIAPPAAHAAMEQTPAPPALIQILPTTPQTFSAPGSSGVPPPPVPDRLH